MTNEKIEEYSNLIYGIAKKFSGYKSKEDLYQAGYIGLITAYNNYDKNSNAKFTTYAYPYIFGEMCKLIREDKGIKVCRNITKLKNSIDKTIEILSQKYMRPPSNYEISIFLEIPEKQVEEAMQVVSTLQSIDEPVNTGEKDMSLYDIIGNGQLDIETMVLLKEIIADLDEESRKLLLYSLNTDLSQQEIGEKFNMNQVKVSRELTKIKMKIKESM